MDPKTKTLEEELDDTDYSFMDEVNENDARDLEAIERGDIGGLPIMPRRCS